MNHRIPASDTDEKTPPDNLLVARPAIYGLTRADLVPLADTVVHVITKGNNTFAATVDGKGPTSNYLLGEWILCADWNPAVYELVAQAAIASGRHASNASLTAYVLWMKHRRAQNEK